MADNDFFLQLKRMIQVGEKRAKENGDVLVSIVEKINEIDPLLFLEKNNQTYSNENFYWQDPHTNFRLVGLGVRKIIHVTDDMDRFLKVQSAWNDILQNAVIYNPLDKKGTGPLLFGGFSFSPITKEGPDPWEKFKNGIFYLPAFMVTVDEDGAYLTSNWFCSPDKPCDLEALIEERKRLFAAGKDTFHQTFIDKPIIKSGDDQQWMRNVGKAIQLLKENYAKKVVLARELRLIYEEDLPYAQVLNELSGQQKDNYIFSLTHDGDCFLGATPERLVRKEGDLIFSACVAGSAPVGRTKQESEALGRQLLGDRKNLDEHAFVVEMIHDVFRQYCVDVHKPDEPVIIENRDILHLYTPMEGVLSKDISIFDIVRSLHPTPALGGTPRDTAIQLIKELELFERGMYASPIGWVDYRSNGEFVVAIRSGLLQGKEASIFAGCGIVKDSDPVKEFEETNIKFRPMLRALGGIGVGSSI